MNAKTRVICLLIALAGVATAAGWGVSAHASTAPSKVVQAPNSLTSTINDTGHDLVFDPPPSGFVPVISADQAIRAASTQEDLSNATSIQPLLVAFTMPDFRPVDSSTDLPTGPPWIVRVPAWDIIADGVCPPSSIGPVRNLGEAAPSPLPSLDPCPFHEAQIIVNATTGEVILEAVYRGPA